MLAACLLALVPLEGFGFVDPCDDGCVEAGEDFTDLGRPGAEELTAHVDQVDAPVSKVMVEVGFQAYRIVAKDHRVHVVPEGYGGIT